MPSAQFLEANTCVFHSIHIIIMIVLLGQGNRIFYVINGIGMIDHLKMSQSKKYLRLFHSIHIIIMIVLLGQGNRIFYVINGFGMIDHLEMSQNKKYLRRQSTSSLLLQQLQFLLSVRGSRERVTGPFAICCPIVTTQTTLSQQVCQQCCNRLNFVAGWVIR
jgi:hypothetical protein